MQTTRCLGLRVLYIYFQKIKFGQKKQGMIAAFIRHGELNDKRETCHG